MISPPADTLGLFSGGASIPSSVALGPVGEPITSGQYTTKAGNPTIARSNRSVQEWFNTNAFTVTPQNQFGNAPRASLWGPGQNEWDLSLMRTFPLGKDFQFQLRGDAFNAFNHKQFDSLQSVITEPGFGTVTGAMNPRVVQVAGRIIF